MQRSYQKRGRETVAMGSSEVDARIGTLVNCYVPLSVLRMAKSICSLNYFPYLLLIEQTHFKVPEMKHFIDWTTYEQVAEAFMLGDMDTEKTNPLTDNLSVWAKENLPMGVEAIKRVDVDALHVLLDKSSELEQLAQRIKSTLERGRKIFLFGCGATGRLSISLEVFCREGLMETKYQDRFVSFMSGGDAALIRSIEKFEDFPEYGSQQLMELGFQDGDLLISTTEGGETPIVIGATETAAEISQNKPYFLYCNPDELLKKVERSQRVLAHPNICTLSLPTGAMALSGSTRMQASTVLMAAVGLAMIRVHATTPIRSMAEQFINRYQEMDLSFLQGYIEEEYRIYQKQEQVVYETSDYAVTVLTDTTERSPTFSLLPFENISDGDTYTALAYLYLPNTSSSEEAWERLLKRPVRSLEWEHCLSLTGKKRLLGFDVSPRIVSLREEKAHQNIFSIVRQKEGILWQFNHLQDVIPCPCQNLLSQNLLLKMLLNIHSTLLMGKLDRYQNNVMTWVKPSNNKLIDRSIRYVMQILRTTYQQEVSYATIGKAMSEVSINLQEEQSIVLETVKHLRK